MKVLDLQCAQHHVFEGWFGSEDDFQSQLTRGLVTCPLCGDPSVTKKLSAPRLNLSTSPAAPTQPSLQEVANLEPAQLQAALLKIGCLPADGVGQKGRCKQASKYRQP